jgi:hypothetical protein
VIRVSFARAVVSGTAIAAVLSVGMSAMARPPYVQVLKSVYPKATLNCQACHDGAPPKLNKYGSQVKPLLKGKNLDAAAIKSLDKKKIKPAGVK